MSNYIVTTDFAAKDALPGGDPNKKAQGTQVDTELDNIATAIATKEDTANKGVANGYAGLDSGARVARSNLPTAIAYEDEANTFTVSPSISHATNPFLSLIRAGVSSFVEIVSGIARLYAGAGTDVAIVAGAGSHTLTVASAGGITYDGVSMRDTAIINTGTFADARIAQSNVTQHQAALTLTDAQVTSHQTALALNASQITSDVGTQSGNFSVTSAMAGDFVICDSASTITITVGNNCLGSAGKAAVFIRRNTGAVTFSASGVTIRTKAGSSITAQHGKAGLIQIDATNFELTGDV